jgi:uncharacterized membrane protein
MNSVLWSRLHGGATHFPIALLFASAFFDALSYLPRLSRKRGEFSATAYWLIILAALGSFGAVASGLVLSQGKIGGTGLLLRHHLFVWPAFALLVGLATWRSFAGPSPSRSSFHIYFGVVAVTCMLIGMAGFFGGELLAGR